LLPPPSSNQTLMAWGLVNSLDTPLGRLPSPLLIFETQPHGSLDRRGRDRELLRARSAAVQMLNV
jgi:hypothetical protein